MLAPRSVILDTSKIMATRDRTLLSSTELADFLRQSPLWTHEHATITKSLEFKTFRQAIDFVGRVADCAEARDHHPDVDIRFRRVVFRLTTHDAGGLTHRDARLAEDIDALSF